MANHALKSGFLISVLSFLIAFSGQTLRAQEGPNEATEACRDLSGSYARIPGSEHVEAPTSDRGPQFTFSRTFDIRQSDCGGLLVDIPLTSKDHRLSAQPDHTYYREGKFLHRNFGVRVVPTRDENVVRLVYEEWTGVLGKFGAVSHYDALYRRE
jgi:hypothetical protein